METAVSNDISGYLKTFFKKNMVYTFSLFLERGVVFLLLPFYTSILSPHDYGVYSIFFASVSIGSFLYSLGIENSLIKFKAEEYPHPKIDSTIYAGMVIPAAIFTLLLFLFSKPFSFLIFETEKYQYIIIFLALSLFFETFMKYFMFSAIGQQKSKMFLIISLSRGTFTIVLNILLVWGFNLGLKGAVWSYSITFFLILLYLGMSQKINYKFSFDKKLYLKLIKYSAPVMFTSVFIMLLNFSDTYILKYFFNSVEVGKYSASYKFGTGMNLFVTAYATAIIPFSLNFLRKTKGQTKILKIIFEIFFSSMILIFLFTGLFYKEILNLNLAGIYIIDPEFHGAVDIIPLVIFSYIFIGVYTNFTIPFHLKGNTHKLALITFAAALTNIILNLIFIPEYSYWGAAISTLASFIILSLLIILYSRKIFPVKYNFVKLFLIIIVAVIIYFLSQNYLDNNLWAKFILFTVSAVCLFYNFRKIKSGYKL